jgi:hypothetical protein
MIEPKSRHVWMPHRTASGTNLVTPPSGAVPRIARGQPGEGDRC